LLVLGFLFGLCAWLGPSAKHRTEEPTAGPAVAAADVPIVAVPGRPLAPYEEPLPAGARVRIGSTRYRHPNGWDHSDVKVAGPYFAALVHGQLALTEVATGRRLLNQSVAFGRKSVDHLQLAATSDGRIVVWADPGDTRDRLIAQVWKAQPDPGRPVVHVTTLRMPQAPDRLFVDSVFFPDDPSELWLLADGIYAFDGETGAYRWHVRSRNRILALDRRGDRFLTSDDWDPWVGFLSRTGMFVAPTYGFRNKSQPKPYQPSQRRPLKSGDDWVTDVLTLTVIESRTGTPVGAVTVPHASREPVPHFALSPDSRYLSYAAADYLCVFDIDRHQSVLDLDGSELVGDDRDWTVPECRFSDDSGRLTVVRGRQVAHFDLATGRRCREGVDNPGVVSKAGVLQHPRAHVPSGYAGVVIADSPDQRLLAVGDATGRLDIWQPDGRFVKALGPVGKGITALAFSPDGHRLAACDRGRTVRVWSIGAWRECDRIEVPVDSNLDELCPDHLVFSPNSRRLLVGRGDILALWDFGTRMWVWDVPGTDPWSVSAPPAFTPDGLWILAHGRESWLGASIGQPIRPISGIELLQSTQNRAVWDWRSRNDQAIALSPDGFRTAMIGDDGMVHVSAAPGSAFRPFPESASIGKKRGVLRFSPDARRLVTCDDAGHAHVWEVASGQLAFTLTYPDGAIHDVRFGADGRSLITSNHREVIVWDLMPEPGAAADPWAGLAAEAPHAEQARRALLAEPVAAVELLKRRLRSAMPVDPVAVAGLVAKLDVADYRERARATAAIQAIGRRVLPLLRESTAGSEEGKTRLAAMIRELSAGPTAYELREERAVEVLEHIGSPAARDLLRQLAAGDAGSVLTEEARAAGRRLH
jgi:WD40 repeat protein